MSTPNQINIEIPDAVITSVKQKLMDCKEELAPYVETLSLKERQTLFKMGDKTVATVQKVESYLNSNPEFAPAYMDQREFRNDVAVVNQLEEIEDLATQIATSISDTSMLAGSEALYGAMLYYGQVREANSKNVLAARPIYEDLQPRFSKKRRKGLGN